jgi:signal peptidase I
MSRQRRIAIAIAMVSLCAAMVCLIIFVACPLTGHPLLKNYAVPTLGMDPTVSKGDLIIGEGFSRWTAPLGRGDVVIFKIGGIQGIEMRPGSTPETVFVQRIAALAGDVIEFQPGKVLVNGSEFVTRSEGREIHYDGAYSPYAALHSLDGKLIVPQGHVFTVGDNTGRSFDGRYWGFVPEKNVLLRARWRYAPSNRRGAIR